MEAVEANTTRWASHNGTPSRPGLVPLTSAKDFPPRRDGSDTKTPLMHHAHARMQDVEVASPGSIDSITVEAIRQGIPR